MNAPRLLDLFSGAGGAALGYSRAGFDVVGIDLADHSRRYPFKFIQADAVEYLTAHGHEYDVIHASPPCQAYSVTRHSHNIQHPELIEPVRAALIASGKPYVIENVVGAPLIDPIILCGSMFGLTAVDSRDGVLLELRRHRLFESNAYLTAPKCNHQHAVGGVYGGGSSRRSATRLDWKGGGGRGGYTPVNDVRRELMGIWHMTGKELSQAIPPAYTEHIGSQLIDPSRKATE